MPIKTIPLSRLRWVVTAHLAGPPQRLGQWRDVPAGSLLVSGGRVDLVQDPVAVDRPVLRPVVLRQPTGHQPAVIGGCGQPAGKLIVHEHPNYRTPITLEVLPDEIGDLPEAETYVSIDVPPGERSGQRTVISIEQFNKLASSGDRGCPGPRRS